MPILIIDFPPEILQKIVLYATLGTPLGPPTELYNCLMTCRTFRDVFSPQNASELYFVVFSRKFDARGPIYRLGPSVVREQAALEMRRRFWAIQIFKRRLLDHPELTEALWIAYLMVEDSDTSQTNVKQLLRVCLPSFLSLYLRRRLYGGGSPKDGTWPTLTVETSLAIALSWTLASQRVMSYEDPDDCREMMCLLMRIAFAPFRYSISSIPDDLFDFGPSCELPTPSAKPDVPLYPIPVPPPQEIDYIGSVRRKARIPSPVLFASLLFLARQERLTPTTKIPAHITFETREDASQAGYTGLTKADIRHFYDHCRTRFADFPGIDIGIQMATSPDVTLCQPSSYKLGTVSGQWQGSSTIFGSEFYDSWISGEPLKEKHFDVSMRKPIYLTLEEHYCCDATDVVPCDLSDSGVKNAWLPHDLQSVETPIGMHFSDAGGTFQTTYKTFRPGQTLLHRGSTQVMDVIITGKTDDQYAAWDQPNKVLGRVRMCDGLVAFMRKLPEEQENPQHQFLQGYVTSSQNFVGKLSASGSFLMGIFGLGKNHTGIGRSPHKINYM